MKHTEDQGNPQKEREHCNIPLQRLHGSKESTQEGVEELYSIGTLVDEVTLCCGQTVGRD